MTQSCLRIPRRDLLVPDTAVRRKTPPYGLFWVALGRNTREQGQEGTDLFFSFKEAELDGRHEHAGRIV